MKTLTQLLLDADPSRSEPRSAQTRAMSRAAILAGPREVRFEMRPVPRRRMLAVAACAVAGAVAAFLLWPSNAVDLVAAVRFEARLAGTTTPIVRNSDIARAEVIPNTDGATFNIAVTFKEAGAKKMREVTARSLGKQLELLIDGKIVMSPTIKSAFPDASGQSLITGNYTRAEADRIVAGIIGK